MFCPTCGNQIPEGQSFCACCGARVQNSYVNHQPQYSQPQYTPQPAPQKSVNLIGIIAAAAAVLVVGGIALGALWLGGRDGDDQSVSASHDAAENGEKEPFGDELDTITLPTEEEEAMVTVYLPTKMEKTVYGDTESVWVELYEYDEQGNMIMLTQYKPDGTRNYTYTMEYDDQGRMIYREYHGSAIYTYEYEYDSLGNQVCLERYGEKFTVSYDSQGRVSRYEDEDGSYHEYVYNSDGSYRCNEFNSAGEFSEYTDYIYDDRGNLIATDRRFPNGDLIYLTEYIFDENNRLVKMLPYQMGSTTYYSTSHAYFYDDYGNLIREEFDGDYYSNDFVSIYTIEPIEVTESAAERLGQ